MFYVRKYTNDWLKQNENFAESLANLFNSNSTDIKFYFGSSTEYSLKELLRNSKMAFETETDQYRQEGDRRNNEQYRDDAMFQMPKPSEQTGLGETKISQTNDSSQMSWESSASSENEERDKFKRENVADTESKTNQWFEELSMSTCTTDRVKQERDLWTYDMELELIGNLIEKKFRKMGRNLCKRCCPQDCFEAFKNVYKRMKKI